MVKSEDYCGSVKNHFTVYSVKGLLCCSKQVFG
jgi:hypothetical protein